MQSRQMGKRRHGAQDGAQGPSPGWDPDQEPRPRAGTRRFHGSRWVPPAGCLPPVGSADRGPHTPQGRGCARRAACQGCRGGGPTSEKRGCGRSCESPRGPLRSLGSRGRRVWPPLCTSFGGPRGQGPTASVCPRGAHQAWAPQGTPVSPRAALGRAQAQSQWPDPPLPLGTSWSRPPPAEADQGQRPPLAFLAQWLRPLTGVQEPSVSRASRQTGPHRRPGCAPQAPPARPPAQARTCLQDHQVRGVVPHVGHGGDVVDGHPEDGVLAVPPGQLHVVGRQADDRVVLLRQVSGEQVGSLEGTQRSQRPEPRPLPGPSERPRVRPSASGCLEDADCGTASTSRSTSGNNSRSDWEPRWWPWV